MPSTFALSQSKFLLPGTFTTCRQSLVHYRNHGTCCIEAALLSLSLCFFQASKVATQFAHAKIHTGFRCVIETGKLWTTTFLCCLMGLEIVGVGDNLTRTLGKQFKCLLMGVNCHGIECDPLSIRICFPVRTGTLVPNTH